MRTSSQIVIRRSRRWAIGISIWVMTVPIALICVRLALPSDGLQTVDPAGGVVHRQVTFQLPQPIDGIRSGDHLLAINGVAAAQIAGSPGDRAVHAGDVLSYRVEHAGQARDVAVRLSAHPDLWRKFQPQLGAIIVGLAILVMACWLVRRRPNELASHALLLFAAGWASQDLLLQAEPLDLYSRPWLLFWSVADMSGYVISGLATLLFACAFPRPASWFGSRAWTATAVLPVLGVLGYATAVTSGSGGLSLPDTVNTLAESLWELTTVAAVAIVTTRWFTLRRDAMARRRMQLVFVGLGVTFGAILVVKWLGLHPSPAGFPFLLAVFPLSLLAAIATRDLYELDLALNRSLVAVTSTVVLLALYFGAATISFRLAGSASPYAALPAAGLVAVALAPVRARAKRVIDHRLFGIGGDPRLVFHRLGVRLAGSDDPDSLMAAVVDTATESLRLPYAAVQLRSAGSWLTVEERGRRPADVETIDITSGTTVVGRLAVAPRRDSRGLSPVDRQLLEDLARHAGVAARVASLLAELRTAQQRLVVGREAERHRIHCDLHDGVGPTLVGLTLQLEVAAELAGRNPLGDLLSRLHDAAARATVDVRGLVRALRPADLDELGLPAAIAAAAGRLSSPNAPRFDLQGPSRLPELSTEIEDAAYKICLEAMSNAVRHSGAQTCSIRLNQTGPSGIGIEIRDDGHGFAEEATPGTGLASMRERARGAGGRLHIDSHPGRGTRIEVELPARSEPSARGDLPFVEPAAPGTVLTKQPS